MEPEQGLGRAYRSYRINGRSRMDVDTFFERIRQNLIDCMNRELIDLGSARVETTTRIRFRIEYEDGIIDRIRLPFNSRMTDIFQSNDLSEIIEEMFTHMKTQIEHPALAKSRFRFDEVLFPDVNLNQLNLTRGSSYIPLPDWIVKKKVIINPKNTDERCFEWSDTAGLHYMDIKSNPECISNLRKYVDNYDWSGLEFPLSIKGISKFEKQNDVIVNVLCVEGKKMYILREEI